MIWKEEILAPLGYRIQRWAYRLAQYLMEWSGSAGADEWLEARRTRHIAIERFAEAEDRRLWAERELRNLLHTMKLIDGLLSTKQPERAQEQLRIALIALDRLI